MIQDLRQEIRIQGVENVEKVLPGRALVLGILVRELPHQQIIPVELGPELLHRELVVVRHLDVRDVLLPDQLLLICQHCLQEVLVDVRCWRQVELDV